MLSSGKNKKPLQNLLEIVSVALLILGFSTSTIVLAQTNTTTPTTINISDTPKVTNAQRLGVNLGTQNFWDSGMMMRNLAFRNPGFEGESWQSILHCKVVTATSCTDDNAYNYWPANFLKGGTASFIVGPAAGTTATITSNAAATIGVVGLTMQFSGLSVAPSVGDFVVVRTYFPGNPLAGWWTQSGGGATFTTDTTDLSPETPGKQALSMNASGSGQSATLMNFDDGIAGKIFLHLSGTYTVSFRAKGTGGSNQLNIYLARNVPSPPSLNFWNTTTNLTNQWKDYSYTFQVTNDTTTRPGPIGLQFNISAGSMLIDDVAFTEAASADNPTVYRNAVFEALKGLKPGTLRYMDGGLNWGSSFDNLLAPDFARVRAGYNTSSSEIDDIAMGLHDFLVLCQAVGADPWFVLPTGMTTQEMSDMMDYFGGSTSTVYGAKRAALGQNAPWTSVFGQIHLEFGNEVWNTANPGANIADAASYGKRASVVFGVAKASPSYKAKSFDLVLDGFEAVAYWAQTVLQNSSNYDTLSTATYNYGNYNDASSSEATFGPMLAEPEYMNNSTAGLTNQQAVAAATAGAKPAKLAIYETNIGTQVGSTTQAQVQNAIPSVAAGIAVAANMLIGQRDLGITVQNMFALEGYQVAFIPTTSGLSGVAATTPIWGVTIDMGGATNLRRPMFLSEQLANSAILPTLLSTSQAGLNPTWNQAYTTNDNFSLSGAHYIQSTAYTDGTTLNIVLFNMSRTSALPVNFGGLNAPVGTATKTVLTAPAINASNESAENVKVVSSSQSLTNGTVLSLPPFSMTVLSLPKPVVPIQVYGVTNTCASASLSASGTTACTATVTGQGKYNANVTWSAASGSVSSNGIYTAPASYPANGKDVVTATSIGDTTKKASFTLTIAPNTITSVTATCPATTLGQGRSLTCTASVAGTGGFSNGYTWSASAGTISSTGNFTAPTTGTSVTLTATSSQDATKSGKVTLTLTPVLTMGPVTTTATGTTATVNWTLNLPANSAISYGPTPAEALSTNWNPSTAQNVSITLTGLKPNTTYYLHPYSFNATQVANGSATVTTTSSTSGISGVAVSCPVTSLLLGASDGCAANVSGTGSYSSAVTWTTSLGSITSAGVLTAPASLLGTSITVKATSVQDPTKSGTLVIGLSQSTTVTAVSLACGANSLQSGGTTTCTPTVTGTGSFSKSVTFSTSAGTITSGGVLTAPTSGTSVTVKATSVQDATKSASVTLSITPSSTIAGVTVSCQASSLAASGTTTCSSNVTGTGSFSSGVTWKTSAGTITSAGVLTAPATGNSVTVTATSTQDATKSASAIISITVSPTITGVTVSCGASSLAASGTTTCSSNVTGTGSFSSGVTWKTSAGTITSAGVLTAPATGSSVTVTATSTQDATKSGTSVVTVNPKLAMSLVTTTTTTTTANLSWWLNQLGNSGATYGLAPGVGVTTPYVQAQTANPMITLTGLQPGTTYYVSAFSFAGGQTVSATLTFTTQSAATVTGVSVNCSASTLVAGSSTACSAAVAGTGSYSSAVTWSTSAGTITAAGVLTAPATGTSAVVKATSVQDPTKSFTKTITVTPASTVSSLTIKCPTATMGYGASMTCGATVTGTGSYSSAVTWTASQGTVSGTGVVTAPATGASLTLTATSNQDPTKSATSTIALTQKLEISNSTFFATPTTIVVSWNVNKQAHNGLDYDHGPNTPWSTTNYIFQTTTSPTFTFTDLKPGTKYDAIIFSFTDAGETVFQNISVTTPLK